MKPDRWQRIDELFQAALSQSPEKRQSFLAKACGGDDELFREVGSLIAHHGKSAMSWERLPSEFAAGMTGAPQTVVAAGRRIGPYQILSLIGAGGMGEVYLAEDTTLGRRVALKLLPARYTRHPDRVLRFEMEARAASALNHPNIVTIHQIGKIDGTHFIVTEFIEGQTLRQRIKNAPMPLQEALDIASQVAVALGSAHAAGIAHRDIKPENVIQRPDGLVKVLDFGLAKLSEELVPVGDENGPKPGIHTESGVVMGTTRYMSPEQARGQRLDARTDIFSLGVVLYEMVSGCPPFAGATASDVLVAILKEDPLPLSHYSAVAPSELDRIVKKALAKELNERYATVKDLQIDLKRLRQNLELQARFEPATPIELKRPLPISRRRAIWLASAAAAAATTGFATWRFWPNGAGIRSLAVLPFVNVAKDEDVEYLCDGITEALITKIHQLPLLQVKAFSLVLNFKGKILDPREVGRQLKVPAILTGTVTRRKDQVTVSAELVDVATGSRLWGETYSRTLEDILSIQEEITRSIVEDGIKLKLSGEEERQLARRMTDDPQALDLYMRGRHLQQGETEEQYLKERDLLKQAVARDPRFAQAYLGLATTYSVMAIDGYERPIEAFGEQKQYLQKALELDTDLPRLHVELGVRAFAFDWDWSTAEREFKLATQPGRQDFIEPEDFEPFALLRWIQGRGDEALQLTRKARDIDRLSTAIIVREADFLVRTKRIDAAIELYNKAINDDPADARAYPGLADALAAQGKFDDAIDARRKEFRTANDTALDDIFATARGENGYRDLGRALARLDLDDLNRRAASGGYVSPLDFARKYLESGEKEKALSYFDEAIADRSPGLAFLKVDPAWESVRNDPRFLAAVRRVGLP